jgi:hypothetical protein
MVFDVENGQPWQELPLPGTVEARLIVLLARHHEARPAQLGLQWRIDVFIAAVDAANDCGFTVAFMPGHPQGRPMDRDGVATLGTLAGMGLIHGHPCRRDLRFLDSPRFAAWLRDARASALSGEPHA